MVINNQQIIPDQAYALVGLGWLYAPTTWPLLADVVNGLYQLWAAGRLRLTGRPSLEQLCALQGGRCAEKAETPGDRGIPSGADAPSAKDSTKAVPLPMG